MNTKERIKELKRLISIWNQLAKDNVIIMDTPEGEVVYYEQDGTTRKDVIARINKNKSLDAMVDAWIYTVKSSVKLP